MIGRKSSPALPVAVVLVGLVSAASARAGSITLTTTTEAVVVDGRLEVRLSVGNQGDEPAVALRPVLRFEELTAVGEAYALLEPGQSVVADLALTFDRIGPGRWPFSVELFYRDTRGVESRGLHVDTFLLGTEPVGELELEIVEVAPLVDHAVMRARVRNLSDGPRTATLVAYLPAWVGARAGPVGRLEAGEERVVSVELVNHSAAAGSRLAAFLSLDHESGGVHRSVVEPTMIEIVAPPAEVSQRGYLWAGAAAGVILVWLAIVGWTGRRDSRQKEPGPAPSAVVGESGPWRGAVDATTVAVSIGFVASHFPPSLFLSSTITNGGDTASHYYTAAYLRDVLLPRGRLLGWCPGNYAGFPFLQFYFPLTFLLMAALSFVIPLQVAFKLVTILGTLLMPACAYLGLRLLGSPFPGPALGAVSSLCFLFMEANSMWGGNIPSTLAGEFTFSLALALAVLFVGSLRWTIRHDRGRLGNSVLVALIGFAHGYALLWAGLVSLLELVTTRQLWRRLGTLIIIHGVAILLMAFWLLPLLWYAPWTTAFNPVWHLQSWQEIMPPILWPAALVAGFASLTTAAISWRRKEPFPRLLGTLWGAVVLSLFFYLTAHSFHVVDIRFMPFLQVSICLLAAAAPAQLLSRLPASWVWPLVALLAVLPFVQSRVNFIPGWVEWNYSGFESKPLWPVFQDINEHLKGDFRDPRVAWEHSPMHAQLGTVRAFESLPHFSGRSTLEGVYLQAAVTAPFVFYIQSEISELISCPFPDWGCGRFDLDRGLEHLEMFNVSQLILRSGEAKRAAATQPGLAREASFGEYEVYRLVGGERGYATALKTSPVLVETRQWKKPAYRWFKRARWEEPVPVFAKGVSVPERSLFAAVVTELPDRLPASPLREPPPLQVEIDVDRITLAGCRPGHPVLVRVSYHPRWRALTGERIWLAGPGLMLVYPRGERVDLVFGRGPVLATGGLATAAGLGIVLLSIMPIGRRLREWALARVGRVAAQAPLRRVVAGIRRSAEWPSKSRRRALWGGVGLVVMLLTLFAYVNASPDAATTYHQGQRLFDAGRLEEAIDLFRRAQERSPLSMTAIHARYFEAIAYYNMARWSEAEERFVALVEAFPEALNVPEGLWHVGLCRLEMGDPAGAIETWRKLVDGFPETRWAGFARQRLTALAVAE